MLHRICVLFIRARMFLLLFENWDLISHVIVRYHRVISWYSMLLPQKPNCPFRALRLDSVGDSGVGEKLNIQGITKKIWGSFS